jgi:hypothetical protein
VLATTPCSSSSSSSTMAAQRHNSHMLHVPASQIYHNTG